MNQMKKTNKLKSEVKRKTESVVSSEHPTTATTTTTNICLKKQTNKQKASKSTGIKLGKKKKIYIKVVDDKDVGNT